MLRIDSGENHETFGKTPILLFVILYQDNGIYHNIVILAFNKAFMTSKFLILYNFHNSLLSLL